MPTYHLLIFPLAVWARKRIDNIRHTFLWKGKVESNGGPCLVAWPLLSKPKALGGLGVLESSLYPGTGSRCRLEGG
jgi:hypothetical protein